MTPEEAKSAAFEAWHAEQSHLATVSETARHNWQNFKPVHREIWDVAWLACSQHYEREIEAVAKELDESVEAERELGCTEHVGAMIAYRDAANLLRTRLLKGGES